MPLADLDVGEREIVRSCLRAAVEGPFFPDWEFPTLFGLARDEVKHILDSWPNLDERNESVVLAINNSFNNLLGYPHGLRDNWSEFIPVTAEELAAIFVKWRGAEIRGYFEGFM
jgi:hypothetical protein